ncbi:hypothetical protein [Agrobacterium pusense]|uniref:hypothetical protein n=1 Tax=Agrobacterium pusense TaxID=648995 RepID=UPI000DD8F73C
MASMQFPGERHVPSRSRVISHLPFILTQDDDYPDGINYFMHDRGRGKIDPLNIDKPRTKLEPLAQKTVEGIGYKICDLLTWAETEEAHPDLGIVAWHEIKRWHIEGPYLDAMRRGYGITSVRELRDAGLHFSFRASSYNLVILHMLARHSNAATARDYARRRAAECPYQVQEMHRHALIQWELEKVAREGFGSLSRLQKVYWLDHIREQLHAWPDLKPKLDEIISHHTEIGRMI